MTRTFRRSRGMALIIVLGILFVLSLLATSMLLLSTSDRSVSMNYMDQVRAGRLARSGVAAAVAALAWDPFNPNIKYWGNDENEDGRGDGEQSGDALSVHDVDLAWCKNPSLAVEIDKDPDNKDTRTRKYSVDVPGGKPQTFGVSGSHAASTYGAEMDVYSLRVTESSACLHLNDGATMHGGNESSVSQNLKRMLNVLGSLHTVAVPGLGDRILAQRPRGGFSTIADLERILSADEMKRVRPFVAVKSWVDKNVANPVPLSRVAANQYPVKYYRGTSETGEFRRGRGKSITGAVKPTQLQWFDTNSTGSNNCIIYGLDELNPSYIEIVHRAPININSARREVLITLLTGLQGFFVGERRAFSPYAPSPVIAQAGSVEVKQKYYSWWTVMHTYDDRDEDADEYGWLYSTLPIAGGRGTTTGTVTGEGTVSAETIADHIIACRRQETLGAVNYKNEWFGGEFRTWTQFNRFIDNLVEIGVIKDTRSIYFDYVSTEQWEQRQPSASRAGQKFGSYAIADAIKANFNPNLHLNELNPDANLFLRVDKTDLIVNSTEFTFRPTGVYEIESLGRVLRPIGGKSTQASNETMCRIESEKRVYSAVRVFEPYRETSQRHFESGSICDKKSNDRTNTGQGLDIGPEPVVDKSKIYGDEFGGYTTQVSHNQDGYRGYEPGTHARKTGWGYEWDGYITLATYGGTDKNKAGDSCSPHLQMQSGVIEGMHVHFESGFDANYNGGMDCKELASIAGGSNPVRNHSDRGSDPPGPLWVGNGTPKAHRLARSFRLPDYDATAPPPVLIPFAPGDLRTDGFYSERNCGAAYEMRQASSVVGDDSEFVPGNFSFHGGALSLWVKPSFFPEHTGKARNIVSMAKHHANRGYRDPAPFNLMFLPAHDKAAYQESDADELAKWSRPGNDTPKGGPLAPKCDYRDPFSPMYDGNINEAASQKPTESRSPGHALGVWQFRPASFMAFRAATTADAGMCGGATGSYPNSLADLVDLENYALTSCLNHNLHPHGLDSGSTPNPKANKDELRPNYFEAHRWTHVTLSWQALPPW